MHGVLVIDKPSGPTSFDVVRRVRSALKVKKAGHTGTLDPMATGVLPVCLGDATKVAGYITEGDKTYEAVVRLGQTTDTLDAEGKVLAESPIPVLRAAELEAVLTTFRGKQLQTPPMYSAVKVGGKRLYELARSGAEIARAARPVEVYELSVRDFSASELRLTVRCSKGFFVRVLAAELGEKLGCGAHLKALRRLQSGPFTLAQALPLEKVEALAASSQGLAELAGRLVPVEEALAELPAFGVSAADAVKVTHGVPLEAAATGRVRVVGPNGRLLAIADVERGRLKYRRVLA
ncbi:MAG: tRNA pseudouridine(55) synthase TruB [Myxococcota bacterium]